MTITPRDIRSVTFGKPALGRRGYSEDDVDPFLEEVADELEGRLEQIDDLTRQLQTARTQLDNLVPAEPQTNPLPVQRPERADTNPAAETAQVTEMLQMASETAQRYVAEAQAKAARLEEQARAGATRELTAAREEAERIVQGAHEQGQNALADYQRRCDDLVVLMEGLRDRLRPYFEQNLADLDSFFTETDTDAPAGAHAKGA